MASLTKANVVWESMSGAEEIFCCEFWVWSILDRENVLPDDKVPYVGPRFESCEGNNFFPSKFNDLARICPL